MNWQISIWTLLPRYSVYVFRILDSFDVSYWNKLDYNPLINIFSRVIQYRYKDRKIDCMKVIKKNTCKDIFYCFFCSDIQYTSRFSEYKMNYNLLQKAVLMFCAEIFSILNIKFPISIEHLDAVMSCIEATSLLAKKAGIRSLLEE